MHKSYLLIVDGILVKKKNDVDIVEDDSMVATNTRFNISNDVDV